MAYPTEDPKNWSKEDQAQVGSVLGYGGDTDLWVAFLDSIEEQYA